MSFNNSKKRNELKLSSELQDPNPLQGQDYENPDLEVEPQTQELKSEFEQYKKYFGRTKTTLFLDPNTGRRHPILVYHSPIPVIKKILTSLTLDGFVQVLNVGTSGSGKTTWTKFLVHQLHMRRNFNIHWFYRDDIVKLEYKIKNLEVGVNHLLVFDDASFALDQLKPQEVSKLAQRLTTIRHDVKAQVVVIINIHYLKGIKRPFRNVSFRFLTSITPEEQVTAEEIFGDKWKLKDFARNYQQMKHYGRWSIKTSEWFNRYMTFETNNPFRIGLANEGMELHHFVYLKQSCQICEEPSNKKSRVVDAKSLIDNLIKSYGKFNATSMIRNYAFTQHGVGKFDRSRKALWRTIAELDKNNNLDWEKIVDLLDQEYVKQRPKHYMKKEYKKKAKDAQEAVEDADKQLAQQDELAQDEKADEYMEERREQLVQEDQPKEDSQNYDESEHTEEKQDEEKNVNPDDFYDPRDMPYGSEDLSGIKDFSDPNNTY